MFPYYSFDDTVKIIEKLGSTFQVREYMQNIRDERDYPDQKLQSDEKKQRANLEADLDNPDEVSDAM